jgi:hypothetical protein
MAATGLPGAVYDPTASQATGALCTGIGISDVNIKTPPYVYTVPGDKAYGFTDTALAKCNYIGAPVAASDIDAFDTRDTPSGKALKFLIATATVAIGGVVATGWLNKTGKALAAGDGVWAEAV